MDFFQSKNIELYDFLNETFKIKKAHRWTDISQNITKAKIAATYKFFSKLFPRNIDYSTKLESDRKSFKSLHFNSITANKIINEVARYSLYSDEIYVFHPIQNPSITNQNKSPIKNPMLWMHDFLDSLYFYIVLEKWVRAGIVKLIINPCEYNIDLRDKFGEEARKRITSLMFNKDFENITMNEGIEEMAELMAESWSGKSLNGIKKGLLKLESPKYTDFEAEMFAKMIFSKQAFINPLYEKLSLTNKQNSILTMRGGGNLESILYVAKLIGGNIYTTKEANWYQLCQLEKLEYWTKIAKSYSKIELPFLNEVDTAFALNLRQDDRLSGVRSELRKIYNTINTISLDQLNESKLRELNEGFIEEIKKSDAEWNFIKKDAQNKRLYWAAATSIGLPVVLNEMSIIPLILGSSFWLAKNIRDERLKSIKFKNSNPLSVFVDLKNKEKNFFSELKNCIF